MRGLPQKQNARRADKIKLCGHLRRYKKIVKKTYIISSEIFKYNYKKPHTITDERIKICSPVIVCGSFLGLNWPILLISLRL